MTLLFSAAKWLAFSPVGRWVAGALAILAAVTAIYTKGRVDDHKAFKETIQRESTKAVQKADTARSRATVKFDAGRLRNDGFRRD
jgi:hypothetical protein